MFTALQQLKNAFEGELFFDDSAYHQGQLRAYATDASVYEEMPLAVAIPKNEKDIVALIHFARKHTTTLIPRAAGTSLAGQVVGNGIVVDISRYFNEVLDINVAEQWVRVQPGVIRDDLNAFLRPHGLMFGPETSTASRAMMGGMLGNNSCGLHSIVWGSVRDHIIEATVILSDGSTAIVNQHSSAPGTDTGNELFEAIKNNLFALLSQAENKKVIENNFPKKTVVRRNTGYALDALLELHPFAGKGQPFNICKLLAGSEGTLGIVTQMKLGLIPLPPQHTALVCIHCHSIKEALLANALALQCSPMASELVDKRIMDYTIGHPAYAKTRFFISGDPEAILMVEFMEDTKAAVVQRAGELVKKLVQENCGYAFPVLFEAEAQAAWELRKAGLGLLRNEPGDCQPVNLIEDCAVAPADLSAYIEDLQGLLKKYNVTASYYAHAGAGELHVEPMINLKTKEGVFIFRSILKETAQLVKKYNGSLSGEHGDGRLRGEFIPAVMGEEVMDLFKQVKNFFDPHYIFNAGKIVDSPAMDSHLRTKPGENIPVINTFFTYPEPGGILKLAERCSGSGDCRRSVVSTGLMCPSYMATRHEFDTTRARANLLRQFLTNPDDAEPFDHQEIKEVMDLCLSCKGCKVECPSGVDITKMKAEFLQHYYDKHGVPFRSKLIGNFSSQMKRASLFPRLYNLIIGTAFLRRTINRFIGFHPERSMPLLATQTLEDWNKNRKNVFKNADKQVFLFCDEFTNYLDVSIGKKTILLMEHLGYEIIIPHHKESGRTYLSKGLVKEAAAIAQFNIRTLSLLVSEQKPIIGIEPSAILTLRDEYKDLAGADLYQQANYLAAFTFTIEEFLHREMNNGNIRKEQFTAEFKSVVLHSHCYQKVLSSSHYSSFILGFPENYEVKEIASGCCGMAGSFGYEQEHFQLSQQVGELVLFPYVRKLEASVLVAAAGTSCRHQLKDGVNKKAFHPVEILYDALKK
jgi:FAD/FMN-containing dehydrogenase/Fe-S oxidoreductase